MTGICENKHRITSVEVNKHRFLRTSAFFTLLQLISIDHTTALGMGREKTLDKGYLWIIAKQRAEISRMPDYDEDIIISTWPGETMHMLFPRYYEMKTDDGELLAKASAVWSLIDENSRELIDPAEHGIHIEGITTGSEIDLLSGPVPNEISETAQLTVPFSYVDINGHVNNARYFDMADDIIPAAKAGLMPKLISVRYASETNEGDTLTINCGFKPDESGSEYSGSYYVTCASGENDKFKMQAVY